MRNSGTSPNLAAIGAVALALAACTATGPVTERWAPSPVGSSWEVAQRNTGSYGKDAQVTWTRAETTWNGAPAFALRGSAGATIVTDRENGHFIAILDREGKTAISYDPPIGWQYPLQVGKSWSRHYRMTMHASGKVVEFDFSCQVEDFEKVTVPAGSFDAFRIHCLTSTGADDTYWNSPALGTFVRTQLRRGAGNPFGAGSQDAELVRRPALPQSTAAN